MSYQVTDTREIVSMSPAGSQLATYRVWLVTDRGATGTVDVPREKWNAADLRAVLDEKAQQLDLAFSLAE